MAAQDIRDVYPVTVSRWRGKSPLNLSTTNPPPLSLQLCSLRRVKGAGIQQQSQPPCNRTNTTARQSSLAAGEGPPIKPYRTESGGEEIRSRWVPHWYNMRKH
ncbi:hypothetical protein MHYP_G00038130 [Metynnis hypsauchen]